MKIAVLASTSGTDLPAVFESAKKNGVEVLLVTNKEDCAAREKAKRYSIPDYFFSAGGKTREEYDLQVVDFLQKEKVDIVLLVGYMRIISPLFVQAFPSKIYNIHPSLLPAFAGGMDCDVHSEVLKKGCKVTGATLHVVTEDVDEGPIVMQKACEILKGETPQSLKVKVQSLEQQMLSEFVSSL